MSKYSRTRKAICRISYIEIWSINRNYFRKYPIETWKETYRKRKKEYLRNCNKLPTEYSYIKNDFISFPCKYKESLKKL